MQKKKVFVTALEKDEALVKAVFQTIGKYGLDVSGHFWNHDEPEITKEIPSVELEDSDAWVIVANTTIPQRAMIGLSLTLLMLKNFSKNRIPVLIVGKEQPLAPILSYAEFCTPEKLGVKLAAKTAIKKPWPQEEFRICAHNQAGVGLWLEVGPNVDSWDGVLVGADYSLGGVLDFQAVGPKGSMPERSTLNYPFKDAKLNLNEVEYTAYGCRNQLSNADSYFVRLKGITPSVIIGQGLGEDASMECFVIKLAV